MRNFIRGIVLDILRSEEGQEILGRVIVKQVNVSDRPALIVLPEDVSQVAVDQAANALFDMGIENKLFVHSNKISVIKL